jgi:type IV pilus assembly protein PilN
VPAQLDESLKYNNRSYFSTVIGLAFRKLDVFGYYNFVTAEKNINLLPNRDNMIAQKKAKVFSNFAFKGIIGGVSLLYIVLFGLSFWNIKTYNDKLVGYEDIIQTHELRVLENKKIQKDIAKIVRSLDISKNIRSNKSISFRVLAQIASAVPKRVKFNSIQYDGNSQIIIEGGAFSDQDILKLISNLNGKKLISQASLATMTLPDGNEQGKQTMKGFKVVCILENV